MLGVGLVQIWASRNVKLQHARLLCRSVQTFAVGDYVWLSPRDKQKPHWRQIPPIGDVIRTRKGAVTSKSIVDRSPGDFVETHTQERLRLVQPTLEEHVLYVDRVLTPLYPRDANVIVSQLDLHPEPPEPTTDLDHSPSLEILEAGTGMGSLSLHLARALSSANARPSPAVKAAARANPATLSPADQELLAHYKSARRAVLHTIERNASYAAHARSVIGTFRNGLYAPTIDQHVGDVSAWIAAELATRASSTQASAPFLSHIVLDLPSAELHLPAAAAALRADGQLLVWAPSISQIERAVLAAQAARLPLVLDDVRELGSNLSGGRAWTVQLTRVRHPPSPTGAGAAASEEDEPDAETEADAAEAAAFDGAPSDADALAAAAAALIAPTYHAPATPTEPSATKGTPGPVFGMVARPLASRAQGGGFLGVWRKLDAPSGERGCESMVRREWPKGGKRWGGQRKGRGRDARRE